LTDELAPRPPEQEASSSSTFLPDDPVTTRRGFLGRAGRKTLYATPVVMTLAAQQAAAASGPMCGSNFKRTIGSPCATDGSAKNCCPQDWGGNLIECHTYLDETTMTCQPPGSPL